MNLSRFSIDNIFNRNSDRIKIQSIEAIEFINKRRSLVDENIQAMLFCNSFTDIRFVEYQKAIPIKTLLHLDLTDLLLRGDKTLFGFKCLEPNDLKLQNKIENYFKRFFAISFFNRFNSISVATLHQDFKTNAERYTEKNWGKFSFRLDHGKYLLSDNESMASTNIFIAY